MVTSRPAEAEGVLTRLSGFLRVSLASSPDEHVRLNAEPEDRLDPAVIRRVNPSATPWRRCTAPDAGR